MPRIALVRSRFRRCCATPVARGGTSVPPGLSPSAELRSAGGGGGERDRTDDLLLAKQALSQLSYTPFSVIRDQGSVIRTAAAGLQPCHAADGAAAIGSDY
jgi:hypothetical protein